MKNIFSIVLLFMLIATSVFGNTTRESGLLIESNHKYKLDTLKCKSPSSPYVSYGNEKNGNYSYACVPLECLDHMCEGMFDFQLQTYSKNEQDVIIFANKLADDICLGNKKVWHEKKINTKRFFFNGGNWGFNIECIGAKERIAAEIEKRRMAQQQPQDEENGNQDISPNDSDIIAASSGTGFFVSTNGHMVTNNHVIDSCDIVKAHYQGRELDANVLFTDGMNDLAIIKANLKPNTIFPVSNEDVSLLEDIIVAGYPLGKDISSSIKTFKGSVTSLSGKDNNFSNFQIDAALNRGNSGGPIVDQKGNVVGVAVAKWIEEGVEGFNFGVKSSTLKTFASSNQFKFQDPSTEELSNKELGQLITEATIYLECWMSVAKIKQIIEEGERQKAFFSEYK